MQQTVITRGSRLGFAALITAFVVTVSACTHTLAGAHAPNLFALVCAFVTLTPVTLLGLRRRFTLITLTAAVLCSQALLHWLFLQLTPQALPAAHTHTAATAPVFVGVSHSLDSLMLALHLAAGVFTLVLVLSAHTACAKLTALIQRIFAFARLLTCFQAPKYRYKQLSLWVLSGLFSKQLRGFQVARAPPCA